MVYKPTNITGGPILYKYMVDVGPAAPSSTVSASAHHILPLHILPQLRRCDDGLSPRGTVFMKLVPWKHGFKVLESRKSLNLNNIYIIQSMYIHSIYI